LPNSEFLVHGNTLQNAIKDSVQDTCGFPKYRTDYRSRLWSIIIATKCISYIPA